MVSETDGTSQTIAPGKGAVVMGEDWTGPGNPLDKELNTRRASRRWRMIRNSPLARKIVIYNVLAILLLVIGILFVMPSRDNLIEIQSNAVETEAQLAAAAMNAASPAGDQLEETVNTLPLAEGSQAFVFDPAASLLSNSAFIMLPNSENAAPATGQRLLLRLSAGAALANSDELAITARELAEKLARGQTELELPLSQGGHTVFAAQAPITLASGESATLVVTNTSPLIDKMVLDESQTFLKVFLIAALVSLGLSLILASTIANPISDLAAAAEIGRENNRERDNTGRVRIPDLTARPDEIGRLSGSLRGMVSALYDRIDANEQFAADVAHEIKNPLASLRSAVGSLRLVKKEPQREQLLSVIEHDVLRLDRLVTDISNASRLDSELVKEENERFDLIKLVASLNGYYKHDAQTKGIEFISDLPNSPVIIDGLENRLAQVFENLISNAISFCHSGDAIRVWVRQKENRVLIVVEDTGPGIPELALTKIFDRFYSERPEGQFGNNSGLGLAISKQIVEAHSGVIWAENITPTDADAHSDPSGARFIVGLPV